MKIDVKGIAVLKIGNGIAYKNPALSVCCNGFLNIFFKSKMLSLLLLFSWSINMV